MFKEKTVLILGAGASRHYGYPTGEELIDEIIEAIEAYEGERVYKSETLLKRYLTHHDPLSIDRFLTSYSSNEELVDLGKQFIAEVLLRKEDPELMNRRRRQEINGEKEKAISNNWYRFLAHKLSPANRNFGTIIHNLENLYIITFNYDVSLEYFIYSRYQNSPIFDDEQKELFFSTISNNINHIYGCIAPYKWQNLESTTDCRENNAYGDLKSSQTCWIDASQYANNIHAMGMDRENDSVRQRAEKAKEKISGAQKLYILGFGFNEDNVSLLDLSNTTQNIHSSNIFITNYGNSKRIDSAIKTIFKNENFGSKGSEKHIQARSSIEHINISNQNVYQALADDFHW